MNVVEEYRFSVARSLGQADVAGNDRGEDLGAEEASKIGGYLAGKDCTVVIHGEEDSFNREGWVECSADAHQGVEELGDSFEREVLTLDGNEN